MKKYSIAEHLLEIKKRTLVVLIFFIATFCISYVYKEVIYAFFLTPINDYSDISNRYMIYTHLTEAFFSYIQLSLFCAFCLTVPLICYQIYFFSAPGLHLQEKKTLALMLIASPILFYLGSLFCFYLIIPQAWGFFLSYENTKLSIPLVLKGKISEYISFLVELLISFGLSFQLPIVMCILSLFGIIDTSSMKNKRRIAVVLIFFIAALITPPDVISQIALALPLVLLYEFGIIVSQCFGSKKND